MDKERVRIATALGWTDIRRESNAEFKDLGYWGLPPNSSHRLGIPAPRNNASDCEALMRWLQSERYDVEIRIGWAAKDRVRIRWIDDEGQRVFHYLDVDDWKRGICDLAIKIIEGES